MGCVEFSGVGEIQGQAPKPPDRRSVELQEFRSAHAVPAVQIPSPRPGAACGVQVPLLKNLLPGGSNQNPPGSPRADPTTSPNPPGSQEERVNPRA